MSKISRVDYSKEFKDWKGLMSILQFRLPSGNILELGPLPLDLDQLERMRTINNLESIVNNLFINHCKKETILESLKRSINNWKINN